MWRKSALLAGGLIMGALSMAADAANWIMILGTEPPKAQARFFGAAAITYANFVGCERLHDLAGAQAANNGYFVNNCRVGPELKNDNKGANLDVLMMGSRGPITPKVNYFMTAQFGSNAATFRPLNTDRERIGTLTDASVTFNHIPGARVRVGLFKKPGPEELLQSLKNRDYIFLTDFTRRDQIERFVTGNAKGPNAIPGQGDPVTEAYDADVGRDWGIQIFDAFKSGSWQHTYAAMVANGNGIHQKDNNDEKDLNLYWSSEMDLPGGKGPYKHGMKFYAYHQQGVRNFIQTDGTPSADFDRIRYGIGVKALGNFFGGQKQRFGLHVMFADGMVLQSAVTSCTDCPFGGQLQFAAEEGNKARGTTIDYGYFLSKKVQLDIRASRNNLLYETAAGTVWNPWDERIISELALGTTYHFTPKTRVTLNYVLRESEAPNPVLNADGTVNTTKTQNANLATSTVGDVAAIRLMHFF